NPVSDLAHALQEGTTQLAYDEGSGYLRAALEVLHVPASSQILVMSKTGVQALHTDPQHPRALFFNDAVTIGYIHGAPLLELSVQDPEQGVLFYTIEQKPQTKVVVDRPKSCVGCHTGFSTMHVPGMLARSQFVGLDGLPLGLATYDADDRMPFK